MGVHFIFYLFMPYIFSKDIITFSLAIVVMTMTRNGGPTYFIISYTMYLGEYIYTTLANHLLVDS